MCRRSVLSHKVLMAFLLGRKCLKVLKRPRPTLTEQDSVCLVTFVNMEIYKKFNDKTFQLN